MSKEFKTAFPCYCCGKDVFLDRAKHIVTIDGARWMSWPQYLKDVGDHDPASPEAIAKTGVEWRPEVYGASCYAREKKLHKGRCKEVIGQDGLPYLFIDETI